MQHAAGECLGSYEIVAPLGAGGMGEVYRARDPKLEREVAIKVLPSDFAVDEERLARFEREAKSLASFNHPNIATIFGFDQDGGAHFLAMELVEGEDLADRIARGPIPFDEAIPLFIQIAEGLEAAHEKGIVHRDLKPANIKVGDNGRVKILDFGLAKAMIATDEPSKEASLSNSPTLTLAATRRGEILGTAAYMSPEQAKGETVDKRTDIWAFGACLYEALSGERAFGGNSAPEIMGKVLEREPDWSALPQSTPSRLVALLRRCLKKEPTLRLRDIGDAWLELTEPAPVEVARTQPATSRRSRWPLVGATGVALLVGLGLGLLLGPESTTTDQAAASAGGRFTVKLAPDAPLSLFEGGVERLAISPDGQRLVYVGQASTSSTTQLYTRTLDELEFQPLEGTEDGWQPFFSPDSRWLAFFTSSGDLKKLSLEGGLPVTIRGGIDGGQWAYGTWGDEGSIIYSGTATSGLQRISSEGGEIETLPGPEDHWHDRPKFLPGGEAVVYQTTTADGSRAVARVLADGSEKVLVDDATDPKPLASGHLLFRRRENLLAAPFDGAKLELTGPATPLDLRVLMEHPPNIVATPQLAVSESGVLFYFPEHPEVFQRSLVWYDRDGPIGETWSLDRLFAAHLSPEADRAAISSWYEGHNRIDILDLERRLPTRLAEVPSKMFSNVVWSADGNEVFFGSGSTRGGRLYRQRVGGQDSPEMLLEVESGWGAIPWSRGPDDVIAFATYDPTDIRFYSPQAGGEIATAWDAPYSERQPVFSPDGRWLAYQSDESGLLEIYVAEYPGGEHKRRVSRGGGSGPLWSRDGTKLFFQSLDGRQLFEVDVRTQSSPESALLLGDQQLVLEGPFFESYDLSRASNITSDGSRFLMMTSADVRRIALEPVVVLDWFPELLRQVLVGG